MTNPVISNFNENDGVRGVDTSEQGELELPGADTIERLSILARQEVDAAIVVTPDVGNTGDGTVAAVVVGGSEIPKVGNYNVECIVAVANGGIFKIENPDGDLILGNVEINPAGAGLTAVVVADGIQFTITDSATDFIVGDKFAALVVINGKYVPFAVDGVGGAQTPAAVSLSEVVATGAGDFPVGVMLQGRVREAELIIDGSAAGVGITDAIKDSLRTFGIIVEPSTQTAELDNQ